jgi:hypothetical protein
LKQRRTNGPFRHNLEVLLRYTAPLFLLIGLVVGAVVGASQRSWESFSDGMGFVCIIWAVVGLFNAWCYTRYGAFPVFESASDDDDESIGFDINPATGLAMWRGSCIDVGGNAYGCSSND